VQNIPGPFHQAPQAIQDEQRASAKFDLCSIVAPISVAALLHACALLDASLIVHIAFLHPTHPASDKQKTTPLQGSPSTICFYIFMSSVSILHLKVSMMSSVRLSSFWSKVCHQHFGQIYFLIDTTFPNKNLVGVLHTCLHVSEPHKIRADCFTACATRHISCCTAAHCCFSASFYHAHYFHPGLEQGQSGCLEML